MIDAETYRNQIETAGSEPPEGWGTILRGAHRIPRLNARAALLQIATNPLVVACLGGILLQELGLGLPPGLEPALKALGAASMPLTTLVPPPNGTAAMRSRSQVRSASETSSSSRGKTMKSGAAEKSPRKPRIRSR